jgi:hypothetical protein
VTRHVVPGLVDGCLRDRCRRHCIDRTRETLVNGSLDGPHRKAPGVGRHCSEGDRGLIRLGHVDHGNVPVWDFVRHFVNNVDVEIRESEHVCVYP